MPAPLVPKLLLPWTGVALLSILASATAHAQSRWGAWEQKYLPEARLCVAQTAALGRPDVSWAEVVGKGGTLAETLSVPDAQDYHPGQPVPASLDGHPFTLRVARRDGPHVVLALASKRESDAWINLGANSHEMRVGSYVFSLEGRITAISRNADCDLGRLEGVVR